MHISASIDRFPIIETLTTVSARVPSQKNVFYMLFISVWLIAWAFGEVSAINTLLFSDQAENKAFMLVWLTMWTLGGGWAIGCLLWQLAGYEILSLDSGTVTQRIEAFGVGISKHYSAKDVKDMRVVPYVISLSNQKALFPPLFGAGHGAIAFDYGSRTIYLGSSVHEAEAKKIVAAFEKRLPTMNANFQPFTS